MAEATQQEKIAWYNVIGQFRKKAREFEALYKRLANQKNIAARDRALAREYSSIMNTATSLKNKIKSVRDSTDRVVKWLKGFLGFGELGVLPLIPIAVVGASVAAVSKWVSDAYVFSKKLDKVQQLESQGMSTSQAVSTVEKLTPQRSILGFDPKWVVIGGLSLVVIPLVLPTLKAIFKD